jgi:hypothetical protein
VADDAKTIIDALDIDLEGITDEKMRRGFVAILNIVQHLSAENARLREENQKLKDEIARLKGEQGKPDIKPNVSGKTGDISSEKRRKNREKRKRRQRGSKMIEVDRTQRCLADRETLPSDAEYKGIETVVIQDVLLVRDNVAFEREKYWSPSMGKVIYGPLPPEYEGYRFGPGVRSLVLMLYYATGTSEPKILELLDHVGVHMSAGELSRLLIHDIDRFHEEKDEVQVAGLSSSPWQQLDDTGQRVNGVNQYCHVLGNPLYSIYRTMPRKDRPTVLAVLRGTETPRYLVNDETVALAAAMGVSGAVLCWFQERLPWDREMDEKSFTERYDKAMTFVDGEPRRKLYEAAALAAYRAQTDVPVVHTLLGDDARQFDELTDDRALCWVHEGRHYAKLTPMFEPFEKELEKFQDRFWDYYRKLRAYRTKPTARKARRLEKAFDELFSAEVEYADLATRIAKTAAKKSELLLVLTHPELPLHNNDSELTVRQRKRKQDVSFGPRTEAGSKAWDTMQSLVGTTKKLGVNIYEYLKDRVIKRAAVPRLADIIRQRAQELNLGASWG